MAEDVLENATKVGVLNLIVGRDRTGEGKDAFINQHSLIITQGVIHL